MTVSVLPVQRGAGRPPKRGQSPEEMKRLPSTLDRYMSDEGRRDQQNRTYNTEDFHVAVSDDNGHDVKIAGIRWHPMMANELNMILARGNFPLDNMHDLIRVLVFDGMKKLFELERRGGVPNYVARLSAINRISLQARYNREFENSLKTVDEEVQLLLVTGKRQQAAMFVHDVLVEAKQIPQKTWRDYYVGHLKQKYGALLREQGQSVKLNRRKGEE